MSMEMYVLSDIRLNSMSEWQGALDTDGFPLRLSLDGGFSQLSGFLPAFLRGKRTGFECYHLGLKDATDGYSKIQFDHEWRYVLAFVWGGDFLEMRAACVAAASYARATNGVLFDAEAGEILNAAEALEMTRDMVRRYAET